MKDFADWIICAFYGLLGALLGFLVFTFALGGWKFAFTGRATTTWKGPIGLIVCLGVGCALGLLSYKFRNREFGSNSTGLFQDGASGVLFAKRLMVIASSLVALYFIWQMAKTLR